ncbi:MAG: hypothetical protein CTY16_12920 [Methylobacter sp.]|nr:MAG: hypothetical protein CTY16_12920 [Methylobacter sp.]
MNSIAWILPNSKEATKAKLNNYIVTVEEIEKQKGKQLPVTGDTRITKCELASANRVQYELKQY